MRTLKTNMGKMYYEKTNEKNSGFTHVLLDSDKRFISNIYGGNKTIKEIKKCKHPQDLFEAILIEGICFAQTVDDLLDEINNMIKENNDKYECNNSLLSLEDLKDNDYHNRVGIWHIFMMN